MLMRQVGIGVESLLSVPREHAQDMDDVSLRAKISAMPRVGEILQYCVEFLATKNIDITMENLARQVFLAKGPVDMLRMYVDVEDCGLIGIISRAMGVVLTNEATTRPLKDLFTGNVTRLDMLGFNAVMTVLAGTDKCVIVSVLREESLVKAVLYDKSVVKKTT